jgi:hypothetical protein
MATVHRESPENPARAQDSKQLVLYWFSLTLSFDELELAS